MTGSLGNLLQSYISNSGIFSPLSQAAGIAADAGIGAAGLISGVSNMGGGQATFDNPIGNYLESAGSLAGIISGLPILSLAGTVLGGLVSGIIGGDPMKNEPIQPDWAAMLRRREMDPRWGREGWREEYDPTTKAGYGKEAPRFGRPTNQADLQWYQQSWAPYASQLFSPYGLMNTLTTGYQSQSADLLPSWTPPVGSPLEQWWDILKERDKASGLDTKSLMYKYYHPGSSISSGESGGMGRIPYRGVNPFAGLTREQMNVFFQPGGALDYIDQLLSQGGWYGHEGLPPSKGMVGYKQPTLSNILKG